MLVPLRHAQGNTFIDLVFTETDRRGVHGADQLVAVSILFIKQRCWLGGIKTERRTDGIFHIGEVIHWLRDVGQEDSEALIERNLIVAIFFHPLPRLFHYLLPLFLYPCRPSTQPRT